MDLFKNAGVNWLGIGIESGSEAVRNASVKGAFLSKIRNIIHTTRDSGISVGSNFIVGLPDDTTQSCIETADLALIWLPGLSTFILVLIYPAAPFTSLIKK